MINEYEDAQFFPKLPADQQVAIESYDMDAFRDSGTHWRYLQFVLEEPDFAGTLEPDPFAAELLAEHIAQFGVLVLRVTGTVAKSAGAERLHPDHHCRWPKFDPGAHRRACGCRRDRAAGRAA